MKCLKLIAIIAVVVGVIAEYTYNYDPKFLKDINDVVLVQKSNICVVLVVENQIIFVSNQVNAPALLTKFASVIKDKRLEVIKVPFIPLNTKDVVQKLAKIGTEYKTFMAYFRAELAGQEGIKGNVTVISREPIGLIGNLLYALGIVPEDQGLLSILTSLLGISASVETVKIVNFEA